jgi:hypothetical protein
VESLPAGHHGRRRHRLPTLRTHRDDAIAAIEAGHLCEVLRDLRRDGDHHPAQRGGRVLRRVVRVDWKWHFGADACCAHRPQCTGRGRALNRCETLFLGEFRAGAPQSRWHRDCLPPAPMRCWACAEPIKLTHLVTELPIVRAIVHVGCYERETGERPQLTMTVTQALLRLFGRDGHVPASRARLGASPRLSWSVPKPQ